MCELMNHTNATVKDIKNVTQQEDLSINKNKDVLVHLFFEKKNIIIFPVVADLLTTKEYYL